MRDYTEIDRRTDLELRDAVRRGSRTMMAGAPLFMLSVLGFVFSQPLGDSWGLRTFRVVCSGMTLVSWILIFRGQAVAARAVEELARRDRKRRKRRKGTDEFDG